MISVIILPFLCSEAIDCFVEYIFFLSGLLLVNKTKKISL